jgi:formylglycine-generating enzyme required for sulfatase activity
MGAQSDDPEAPNYDPQALGNEGRVRRVRTSAFLLAKHEMTQAQWLRLTGSNPSFYQRHEWSPTLLHPVEGISWVDCMTWLPRAGLTLPSEAQWEYGARAATQTPWFSGAEKESLQGAANLIDGYAHSNGGAHWFRHEMWMDDGSTGHAEVGRYRANAFGLHDVVGNVTEWCIDGLPSAVYGKGRDDDGMPDGTLDPVSPWEDAANRVARGGSFIQASMWSRSSFRAQAAPTHGGSYNGVRPCRPLDP